MLDCRQVARMNAVRIQRNQPLLYVRSASSCVSTCCHPRLWASCVWCSSGGARLATMLRIGGWQWCAASGALGLFYYLRCSLRKSEDVFLRQDNSSRLVRTPRVHVCVCVCVQLTGVTCCTGCWWCVGRCRCRGLGVCAVPCWGKRRSGAGAVRGARVFVLDWRGGNWGRGPSFRRRHIKPRVTVKREHTFIV